MIPHWDEPPRARTSEGLKVGIIGFLLGIAFAIAMQSCSGTDEQQAPGTAPVPSPEPTRTDVVCTQEFVYGLHIRVTDMNGNPISGAQVFASEGAFSEQLTETDQGLYVGVGERPGSYLVHVSAPGYQARSDRFTVTANECHVVPVRVTFAMDPA